MGSIRRLYVDSNIFIYTFESENERAEQLRRIFSIEPEGTTRFLTTSELTLSETLTGAFRTGNARLIEIYSAWIKSSRYIEVAPVRRNVLRDAALLRARYAALKLPDAIRLATAFAFDCSHFLTGDKRLRPHYEFIDHPIIGREPGYLQVLQPEAAVLERLIDL